jgi:hypothetical protein
MHPFRILRFVKHTFWPGFNNSFHPYVIRVPALAVATGCLLLVQVAGYVDGRTGDTLGIAQNITEDELLRQTNRQRRDVGLRPLREDRRLAAAARDKAEHMLQRGYWSHYGPEGTTPWSFIKNRGYDYQYAGENLAKGFQTSSGVTDGWLNSPGHRENLLGGEYQHIGIAAADGYLNGEQTTVVVAMYGSTRPPNGGAPIRRSDNGMVLPATQTYSPAEPLSVVRTMPPAAQLGAAVALMLGVVYLAQHVTLRRKHLLWDAHVHPRPVLQSMLLVGIVVVLIQTSYGAVG